MVGSGDSGRTRVEGHPDSPEGLRKFAELVENPPDRSIGKTLIQIAGGIILLLGILLLLLLAIWTS